MALTGKATETGAAGYISAVTPTTLVTNAQGANLILNLAKLLVINVDTSVAHWVTIYKVPSGGSISGDDYVVVKQLDISPAAGGPANTGVEDIRECAGMLLENGDSLRALAETATKLKFDLSYWAES